MAVNSPEHGLFQLLDMGLLHPNQPATEIDSGLLVSAIQMDTAQHNADINAVLRLFANDTTEYQSEVSQSGTSRSQPLDENGRAIPIKPVAPYTVAFPIRGSGSALGANYVTRSMMMAQDLANTLSSMYRGDYQWVFEHVLGAIYNNVNYTFRDPTGRGDLTIRGPANGDGTLFYKSPTNSTATDSHLLFQAAGIADATNPFPAIKTELLEHPSNTGEVIAFIPTNLVATATALAEFRSATLDPDIQLGVNTARLIGGLGLALPPFTEIKGKTDSGVWIVEWSTLPDNYIIAVTTTGARPLRRRLFPVEKLQGFKSVGERNDFPYFEEQWQRWEDYGAFNRVGVVVYRVGTGSYAVPTGFGVPMP